MRKFIVIKSLKYQTQKNWPIVEIKKGEIYTEMELFGDLLKDKKVNTHGYVTRNTQRPLFNWKISLIAFLKHFKEIEEDDNA